MSATTGYVKTRRGKSVNLDNLPDEIHYILERLEELNKLIYRGITEHQANRALINGIHVTRGRVTTLGGAATEEIVVRGVREGQLLLVNIEEVGSSPVSIVSCKVLDDKISITFSADPSNDHVITYHVIGE